MIPDIDRIQSGNAQTRRHGCVWNFKEGFFSNTTEAKNGMIQRHRISLRVLTCLTRMELMKQCGSKGSLVVAFGSSVLTDADGCGWVNAQQDRGVVQKVLPDSVVYRINYGTVLAAHIISPAEVMGSYPYGADMYMRP
ncbi:hypothetical protein Ac2012v2_002510 [Leucoagaricus gongylophorus]